MRLLDLFCGAGGAAMGYHRAGFEVFGVDIEPQPDYPFQFLQADAITLLHSGWKWSRMFDVIHASPPCQGETSLKALHQDRKYKRLLIPTLDALRHAGVPWVVENVDAADAPTDIPRVRLCGSSFDLRVRRHRWFWNNTGLTAPPCDHASQTDLVGVYGNSDGAYSGPKRGPRQVTTAEAREVMDMPWVTTRRGLTDAIPPAYTEHIGRQLMALLQEQAA